MAEFEVKNAVFINTGVKQMRTIGSYSTREAIGWGVVVLLLTPFAGRFLTEIVGAATIIWIVGLAFSHKTHAIIPILVIAWIISLSAPVDLAIRGEDSKPGWGIAVVDVVYNSAQMRAAQTEGRDFIVYRRVTWLFPVRKVILIKIPGITFSKTPLFQYL